MHPQAVLGDIDDDHHMYSLRSKIDDSTLYYIWEQREYHHMEGTEEA